MRPLLLSAAALCLLGARVSQAQTAADPNEGVRITADPATGAQVLAWWGRAGRTYFVQQSYDLINWTYVPVVQGGGDAPDGLNFACTDARQFWRLQYTDVSTGGLSAADADFDDDGLSNQQELLLGTNPFNPDTDGDGYYDGQEVAQSSDPSSAASAPNENFADYEQANRNEQPVALFEQTKSVENSWMSSTPPTDTDCHIDWYDYSGNTGDNLYNGASGPKWSSKMASLVYPLPQTSPSFTYYDTGAYCAGGAELRGTTTGYANLVYHRVGLYSNPNNPVEPWAVSHKYFTYNKTFPSPNDGTTPPVFGNVDMVPLQIYKGQNMTALDKCLLMEPTPTSGSLIYNYVVGVTATTAHNELDNTGTDLWLTLQAGGDGVPVQLQSAPGMPDNISFQASGGGVTPAQSTPPFANWPYTETYSSSTAGEAGHLSPAVGDDSGNNVVVAAHPLLQFDVKEPQELYVTLRIIGRDTGSGIVAPASPPSAADLKAYLDSVFVPQVNVHTYVTIMSEVDVAFDVGLKQSYGNKNRGVSDDRLSILYGQFDDDAAKVMQSDEEAAILAAAPPDTTAAITIYWVACAGMDEYNWQNADAQTLGDPNQLQAMPQLGNAGKAWQANRVDNDIRARVIWIMGQDEVYYQSLNCSQMFCIAHELGHALGNLMHTIDKYDVGAPGSTSPDGNGPWSGYSDWSDNNMRLMTGMSGPKRRNGPTLLNKLERDKISLFNYVTPNQ